MNLHPFTTHFPIVLLLLALFFEIAPERLVRKESTSGAIQIVLWGAVLMIMVSYFTGDGAGDSAHQTFLVPESAIEKHHLFGKLLLFLIPIVAMVNFASLQAKFYRRTFYIIYIVLIIVAIGVTGFTGYLGGELIFEHGAGVTARQ